MILSTIPPAEPGGGGLLWRSNPLYPTVGDGRGNRLAGFRRRAGLRRIGSVRAESLARVVVFVQALAHVVDGLPGVVAEAPGPIHGLIRVAPCADINNVNEQVKRDAPTVVFAHSRKGPHQPFTEDAHD